MVKTMVKQAVPIQPMEDDGGAEIPLQPMEDPTPEQVEAPEGGYDLPLEAHAGASSWQDLWREEPMPGLLAGLVTLWGTPHWSSLLLKVCTLWKGPTLEQFVKNCSPWEGLKLEKFVEDCLP
ncbi:zinc finger and BTB domain-containing protein 5 [Grus japonensis]|uniref:Zinc finger and BTB domain-containing protein 5 n=1 Tax=Grus japonensis TaxID=30415 RepID=A0ABC9YGW5_GRUJA